MKFRFILWAAILLAGSAPAQVMPYAWAKAYGTTAATDRAFSVAADRDGNVLVTGHFSGTMAVDDTSLTAVGDMDAFVLKLTSTGQRIWALRLGGTGSDVGYQIETDRHGNVYVLGAYASATADIGGIGLTSAGSYNLFIAKLDPQGRAVWATGSTHGRVIPKDLAISVDGSVLAVGSYRDTAAFGPLSLPAPAGSNSNAYLLRLDSAGTLQWVRTATGDRTVTFDRIASDGAGNAVLTGTLQSAATLGNLTLPAVGTLAHTLVARYGADGTTQWAVQYGGTAATQALGIALAPNGDALLAGSATGTVTFQLPGGGTQTSPPVHPTATVREMLLPRFGVDGTLKTVRRYAAQGFLTAGSITAVADGRFLLRGSIQGSLLSRQYPYADSAEAGDSHFAAYADSSGSIVWTQGLRQPITATLSLEDLAADASGNLILAGYYQGTGLWVGPWQQAPLTGSDAQALVFRMGDRLTAGPAPLSDGRLCLYPQPARGPVWLDGLPTQPTTLRLRDLHGRILWQGTESAKTRSIPTSGLSPGVYGLDVQPQHGSTRHMRLLVEN